MIRTIQYYKTQTIFYYYIKLYLFKTYSPVDGLTRAYKTNIGHHRTPTTSTTPPSATVQLYNGTPLSPQPLHHDPTAVSALGATQLYPYSATVQSSTASWDYAPSSINIRTWQRLHSAESVKYIQVSIWGFEFWLSSFVPLIPSFIILPLFHLRLNCQ